ncbi:MAG TPA: phospho-N-acetylmuramoyl-pentapeptide-transferase [Gammaproteobacteria bacterium]|nr:phospho-N-acetylmuramoyl-pentapeptide-transferase [Gammaproteobacteria bacterium]
MLYYIFTEFFESFGPARVFQYPSFRIPAAALTALILTLVFFPRFIDFLREKQHGVRNVREDTPEQHQKKTGTPTMGGLFILGALAVSTLLWANLVNVYVLVVLWITLSFGAIGFIDDYSKVKKRNSKGLPGRWKIILQTVSLGLAAVALVVASDGGFGEQWVIELDTSIAIPFVSTKIFNPDLGILYFILAFFVIVGTSNAVNLTDGLDGLAIGPTIVSSATFLILAYIAGLTLTFFNGEEWVAFNVAEYLNLVHIPGLSELAVLCAALIGAGIGFLWFNSFPASVFMGDVGSLAIGGCLGTLAVLTKHELLSAIIHGVFLMEALSVITQVGSFKLTGKRVFKMAPIHHHFELKGWAEPKIIVRFWILAVILALISLTTLKLR